MKHRTQRGFTLIELIIVIIILGILSVVALPRMLGFGTEARVAAVESMLGTIEFTSKQVNYKCQVSSECDASLWGPQQTLDGNNVCLLQGWFDAGTGGPLGNQPIGSCGIDAFISFNDEWQATVGAGGRASTEHWFRLRDAPDPANCYAAYRQPINSGDLPQYRVETSGC
jgi:prepilin-type N-terminal cleavage/methylation domain-containing protein